DRLARAHGALALAANLERGFAFYHDVGLGARFALFDQHRPGFCLDLFDELRNARQLGLVETFEQLDLGQPLSSVVDLLPERHGVSPLEPAHRSAAAVTCSVLIRPSRRIVNDSSRASTTVDATPAHTP